jgi:alkanesulfonate monooxygenase SsuD/methylene tetrahydromethanopterin reductase-like flavin-dependent oxidoreductase (luciferase family)
LYRQNFVPSAVLEQPYAIVTAAVLTAETDEEAAWFAAPGQLMTFAIRTGRSIQLLSPQAAADHPDLALARSLPTNRIIGAPETVVARLEALVHETSANEIMVFTFSHGLAERIRSLELLAQAWSERPTF